MRFLFAWMRLRACNGEGGGEGAGEEEDLPAIAGGISKKTVA